jgi:hypothetical protein
MKQGETYSMLFPYCLGCDIELDENNQIVVDEDEFPILSERDYWDYWSGKFLIFESTKATSGDPHIIKGSHYVKANKVEDKEWIFDSHPTDMNVAVLTGNSTFDIMELNDYSKKDHIYAYSATMHTENYYPLELDEDGNCPPITPTSTFLLNGNPTKSKMITREGKIIRSNNGGVTTGGHTPTVGGGNDLFITSINGGINVAVAAPQQVRVISSTGAVLYNGWVSTSVDVALPIDGIYIVSGENEVQKIRY